MSTISSVMTDSNVNYSGSGKLRSIALRDTVDASLNLDATISINIDGAGAVSISLNNFIGAFSSASTGADNAYPSLKKDGDVFNITYDGKVQSESCAYGLDLNLHYQTSLVVTIANADNFIIVYDKEVF